jgi:general L-amino acid transport system permease protein
MAVQADTSPRTRWWNDERIRAILVQLIVVTLFTLFIVYIVNNTAENMAARGLKAGFGFMNDIAGFMPTSPGFNVTNFDVNVSTHGEVFLLGLVNTLLISAVGIVLATIVGFIFGVLRLSDNLLIRFVAACYVEGTRNIPLLLQILIWYFGVILPFFPSARQSWSLGDVIFFNDRYIAYATPVLEPGAWAFLLSFLVAIAAIIFLKKWAHKRQEDTGEQFPVFWTSVGIFFILPAVVYFVMGQPISWDVPELKGFNYRGGAQLPGSFMGMLAALTFYTGAFIAENVRAGIQSVSHGQTEASYALGLRPGTTTRLIIIPQAMRVIVPPVTSQYLNLAKNSSLAIIIGYPDLVNVFSGISLNQTGNAVEIIAMTMLVYLTISLLISAFMNWYNRRVALVER